MPDAEYREIPLRARDGSIRAVTLVDASDYARLTTHRWKLTATGYAQREHLRNGKWTSLRMARVIMGLQHGDLREVDHINRDKLDNRRENLRIVTRKQQGQNHPGRGAISGHHNVYAKANGTYNVRICGRHIGSFRRIEDAVKAAQAARAALSFAAD